MKVLGSDYCVAGQRPSSRRRGGEGEAVYPRSDPDGSSTGPRLGTGQSSCGGVMKFSDVLLGAIGRSEIPLRFEPGAEEAMAKPILEVLQAWIQAHMPAGRESEFDAGYRALAVRLL